MRALPAAAAQRCSALHGNHDLTTVRATRQRPCWHAGKGPGMLGLFQGRAVLHSLRQGVAATTAVNSHSAMHTTVVAV